MNNNLCDMKASPVTVPCGTGTPPELPALPLAGVSAEQLKAMQDYAKKLKRNAPGMKPARLQRKVAEHFKIKLT
jgi:hypothetical protein